MAINQQKEIIGIFGSLETAGEALDHLILSGFPLAQTFLIGQPTACDKQTIEDSPVIDLLHQASINAVANPQAASVKALLMGNLTGGFAGLLLGMTLVPGIGQVILGCTIASTLLAGGIGTALGGLIAGRMHSATIQTQIQAYADLAAQGNYLLIVKGSEAEIFCAEHILYSQGMRSSI